MQCKRCAAAQRTRAGADGGPVRWASRRATLSCLLGLRCLDRRRHILLLLGWRQHRRKSERLLPQLAGPALRVIEVAVLVGFHRGIRSAECLAERTIRSLSQRAD